MICWRIFTTTFCEEIIFKYKISSNILLKTINFAKVRKKNKQICEVMKIFTKLKKNMWIWIQKLKIQPKI
jgi:hypothetical protein